MAINITLYKTNSPRNKITKTLTDSLAFESCNLLDTTDVLNPNVRLSSNNDLTAYNYMYIPATGRYYFITPVIIATGLYALNAVCDVLMSHATEIRKQAGILARSSSVYNTYLSDPIYLARCYRQTHTIKFPNSPFTTSSNGYYLLTSGALPPANNGGE